MAVPSQTGAPVSLASNTPRGTEQVLAWANAQRDAGRPMEEWADEVAYWASEDQALLFSALDASTRRGADPLQSQVQRIRQEAFRNGEILPGVDPSGGGTGLPPDAVQSILSGRATQEAEGIQSQQPGLDAYQEDVVLDQGPGYSLLDGLNRAGAWQDEDVDPLALEYEDALQQERTDTTGRDAQERSLNEYDQVIAQEGLTDVDRARIEEMRQATARRGRAQEEAVLADAAEQGRAGGNASLLLRSQAQQRATNERALGDMQTAAMGLERKDQAIRNRGFLGGDVQAADDMIDRFNTQNSQEVVNRNVDRKNRGEVWERELEEGNRAENVDVKQGAVGVDYDNDTARSDKNTDRTNEQNAANDRGTQQRYRDMWSSFGNKYDVVQSGPAFDAGDKSTPGSPADNGLAAAGQGAIGGASAGAALGPWGAAGGAVLGGAAGFLGGRKKRERGSTGAW